MSESGQARLRRLIREERSIELLQEENARLRRLIELLLEPSPPCDCVYTPLGVSYGADKDDA